MSEYKKNSFKRFLLIYLFALVGVAILLTMIAVFDKQDVSITLSTYFFKGGIVIAIIGFLSLGQNNRISRSARSKFRTDNNYFKKIREKEKPFDRISWAIIFAGISIASIGYFLIKNMN